MKMVRAIKKQPLLKAAYETRLAKFLTGVTDNFLFH